MRIQVSKKIKDCNDSQVEISIYDDVDIDDFKKTNDRFIRLMGILDMVEYKQNF